ncbi:MAG: bifunctional tRNA (5-methylaminomethyl-2-thiouridine)(34)-methyltransferase MnmD/FAD-dependent 5-carboxymethylaminomethyl-2-thiouridine(34) oxidoreductase MnmC [Spongiibacteraceae bacterium]
MLSAQHGNPHQLPPAQLDWGADGAPRSVEFGDVYFSRAGGLDETDYVFLQQNRLRERWQHLDTENPGVFVIAETGFGTGLNFLAAWQLWTEIAPHGWRLCFISAEQYPLTHAQLTQALAAWPQLAELSTTLLAQYPPLIRGFHRRELAPDISLQLLFDDAGHSFDALLDSAADLPNGFAVDAWFLDGFAPAKNPGMWTPPLFRSIARLSKTGSTFATFTCAGQVKRGLREVGFEVQKVPGHGTKREMLRGVFCGQTTPQKVNRADESSMRRETRQPAIEYWAQPPAACRKQRVIVIGGGLAGSSTASALARRGWPVTLLERGDRLAGGASGNPQGVLYTKLSPQAGTLSAFALLSYLHALDHYRQLQRAGILDADAASWCGVLQLETDARLREVFADQTGWVQALDAAAASVIAGCAVPTPALWFPRAGWLRPARVCTALAAHPLIDMRLNCNVRSITRRDDGWSVQLDNEEIRGSIVVIAAANDSGAIHPAAQWPVRPMRGQITTVPSAWIAQTPRTVICHEGYLAPERDGNLCIGATFDKDDDVAVRAQDHLRNLQSLTSALPSVLKDFLPDQALAAANEFEGRVGFRCTTPDYLPIVGAVADAAAMRERFAVLARNARSRVDTPGVWLPGLYVNIGHGSRGLTSTPLCAETLAALITGEPRPLPRPLLQALSPARFILRDLIRGRVEAQT